MLLSFVNNNIHNTLNQSILFAVSQFVKIIAIYYITICKQILHNNEFQPLCLFCILTSNIQTLVKHSEYPRKPF